jgi:hypothetical protein
MIVHKMKNILRTWGEVRCAPACRQTEGAAALMWREWARIYQSECLYRLAQPPTQVVIRSGRTKRSQRGSLSDFSK